MRLAMIVAVVTAALPLAGARAGEVPTRAAGTGLATGAVAGALIGGPPGAVLGLAVGGFIGDRVESKLQADAEALRRESELIELRAQLARLEQATPDADRIAHLGELAERLRADVFFRTGSAELEPEVRDRLAALGGVLAGLPGLAIDLHGFADPRGPDTFNRQLSEQRVAAVQDALERGGTPAGSLRVSAHGASLSTAPAGDLEAYAWERRVSIALSLQDSPRLVQSQSEP